MLNKIILRNNNVMQRLGFIVALVVPLGSLADDREQIMVDAWLQQEQAETGLVGMAAVLM